MQRRLTALLAAALLGAAVIIALALLALGPLALLAYLLLLAVGLSFAVRRPRAARQPVGRTCSCCTSTVFDPVEVR